MQEVNGSSPNHITVSIGDLIADRYLLVRELGSGGMGAVFVANDQLLSDTLIALKILHPEQASSKEFVKRFLREVEIMRQVNHDNVVRTFDVGMWNKLPYYTMELVQGHPLNTIDPERFLDSSFALSVTTQILDGLQTIHNNGIVHRDLKPENIIIDSSGRLKIADFGIAKLGTAESMTSQGAILGSPGYLAPEIWQGEKADARSDLYAVGVLLYECVTGNLLFNAESLPRVMWQHINSVPSRLSEVQPGIASWLDRLVDRLLQKDPLDRLASVESVLEFIQSPISGDAEQPNNEDGTSETATPSSVPPPPIPTIVNNSAPTAVNGLLFQNNPTTADIAMRERMFEEQARSRREQLQHSIEEKNQKAQEDLRRVIKLSLLTTPIIALIIGGVYLLWSHKEIPEHPKAINPYAIPQEQLEPQSKGSWGFGGGNSTVSAPQITERIVERSSQASHAILNTNTNAGVLSSVQSPPVESISSGLGIHMPAQPIAQVVSNISAPISQPATAPPPPQPDQKQLTQLPVEGNRSATTQPSQLRTNSETQPPSALNGFVSSGPAGVAPNILRSQPARVVTSAPEMRSQPELDTIRAVQDHYVGLEKLLSDIKVIPSASTNAAVDRTLTESDTNAIGTLTEIKTSISHLRAIRNSKTADSTTYSQSLISSALAESQGELFRIRQQIHLLQSARNELERDGSLILLDDLKNSLPAISQILSQYQEGRISEENLKQQALAVIRLELTKLVARAAVTAQVVITVWERNRLDETNRSAIPQELLALSLTEIDTRLLQLEQQRDSVAGSVNPVADNLADIAIAEQLANRVVTTTSNNLSN